MRFDPFRELERLGSLWGQPRSPVAPLDAYRSGDRYVVQLDLPGVDPDSIDLTVEKRALTVRADRLAERPDSAEWVVAERPHGAFQRQLFLGDGLDTEHVEATYDKGVLTVTIPVADTAKPRRVEIARGGRAAIEAPTA